MKSAVVTGATSMLGIATIKECLRNNVKVLAISRGDSRRREFLPKSKLLRFVACDLSELDRIALEDMPYDVFYHFGWGFTDRTTRDDPKLQSKNIDFTLDAVDLAYRLGCKRFVGAGSQAEYGSQSGLISEDAPCKPEVCYGISKFAAGKLAKKLCDQYGMACIWTRTFSVYGTNDSPNVMTSYAVRQFQKGEVAEFSAGTQYWDYLFEDDAGVYFYRLGLAETESCVVHIAGGDCRTIREYILDMAGALGDGFQYHFAEPSQTSSTLSIQPDVSLLRSMTGYIPKVTFAEGIQAINRRYNRENV